jgi:hypothetical protein
LRPRIAAVVVLLTPVVTAIVAAVALAGDLAIAALAVGLVVVASAAVWFALTRRGLRRGAGAALAGLAGAALIVVLRFTSMPGALRVRLPRAVGLAPGARAAALTADNLGALLRVAVGK